MGRILFMNLFDTGENGLSVLYLWRHSSSWPNLFLK